MATPSPPFVHLHTHSAFSYGDGASTVPSLVLRAVEAGQPALALTDTNSLSGIPTLVQRCKQIGIKPIGGCEVILEGGDRLTLLADGPAGFRSLCQILSAAGLRDIRREGMRVRWDDLAAYREGLVCLSGAPPYGRIPRLLFRRRYQEALDYAERCLAVFGRANFAIEVVRSLAEGEAELSHRLLELADYLGIPAVATNGVCHAVKDGLAAHEALRRVQLGLAPHEQHGDLPLNGERYLKSGEEMARLFTDRPEVLRNTASLAERLAEPLNTDPKARHLPRFPKLPPGQSAFSYLAHLTFQGAEKRYRDRLDSAVEERLCYELDTICKLGVCDYFLVCWDVCEEARKRGIGFGLRGSAVGSAVTYCLGMSRHDPIAERVSFERFLSSSRAKLPDIDIDFRHDLRDEMMAYVRNLYGEDRVANVANYVSYRGRSLLRDLGKVLGFDTPELDRLRKLLWQGRGDDLVERLETQPELRALGIEPERYADLFALCAQLAGLPRHLGTHSSGLVISDVPMAEVAPVLWAAKGVRVAAFDRDDVESPGIGLLKMDQLSLRALTAIDIATQRLIAEDEHFAVDTGHDDPDTYAMIQAGQTIGVFQLESPAQIALQWRLRADKFEDLVASVALVRPGPLIGGGVEPYVRCRHGQQAVAYPLPELEPILKDSFGRILYQDQVLEVIKVVGDFTSDEADRWLKAMTHTRSEPEMEGLGRELYARARKKGIKAAQFRTLWRQIKGFSHFGFCHGHALAFASHAYRTAWLLKHYPAEFLAATLSVEPCGFWPVPTLVAEAVRRGVRIGRPCLNRSEATEWAVEREEDAGKTIRCSLVQIESITRKDAAAIIAERQRNGPFQTLIDAGRRLWFLTREQMEWLTLAGAFDILDPNRRRVLWSLPVLHFGQPEAQRKSPDAVVGQEVLEMPIPPLMPHNLPDFDRYERFERQWDAINFWEEGHPIQEFRKKIAALGLLPCGELQKVKPGERVGVAGLVLHPHRPPTLSGQIFVFLTLEDESGLTQVTVRPEAYERCGKDIFALGALAIWGVAEQRGTGMILMAERTQRVSEFVQG